MGHTPAVRQPNQKVQSAENCTTIHQPGPGTRLPEFILVEKARCKSAGHVVPEKPGNVDMMGQ